jgi:hypothetical protein
MRRLSFISGGGDFLDWLSYFTKGSSYPLKLGRIHLETPFPHLVGCILTAGSHVFTCWSFLICWV